MKKEFKNSFAVTGNFFELMDFEKHLINIGYKLGELPYDKVSSVENYPKTFGVIPTYISIGENHYFIKKRSIYTS